jgi:group I intron endonuclease
MYIYKFTHIESGKIYIGQTIQNPRKRMLEHISGSKYTSKKHHFHNALRKYGVDAFTWEVIATANSLEELNLLEEKYVIEYNSINYGYNLRQPGNNKKHNINSIKKMSESQKISRLYRKLKGTDKGWKRKDGGPMKGKIHPNKGGTSANKGMKKGMTWEEIYGTDGAALRRLSHAQRATNRKSGG